MKYRKSSIKPPGGLFFFKHFRGGWGGGLNRGWGLKRTGGLFNLAKCINGSKVSRGRTCGHRALYCFSNNKEMVSILLRELEHKVEKVQHMKVESCGRRPKTTRISSLNKQTPVFTSFILPPSTYQTRYSF